MRDALSVLLKKKIFKKKEERRTRKETNLFTASFVSQVKETAT